MNDFIEKLICDTDEGQYFFGDGQVGGNDEWKVSWSVEREDPFISIVFRCRVSLESSAHPSGYVLVYNIDPSNTSLINDTGIKYDDPAPYAKEQLEAEKYEVIFGEDKTQYISGIAYSYDEAVIFYEIPHALGDYAEVRVPIVK